MKTVKFYTLGCKVNQYDTQEIRERFLESGFVEAKAKQPADVYVVNTCTVTAKADKDSLYYVHRSHRENPRARIIVTGCLAGLDPGKIKDQPGVVMLAENRNKTGIAAKLLGKNKGRSSGISSFEGHTRAFLKIQDGCDNFCSYCRVPLARGRSRSKPLDKIVRESEKLVKSGFKEIVLTGICLGSYGKDLKPPIDLVDAIEELEKNKGLLRIRLSSIEAGDVSGRLIDKMVHSSKLCPHLHIPIQSGDDEILKKMRRKYYRRDYLRLINRIRKKVPGAAITTDVLVGFPGEEEKNFLNTVSLVKKIEPLRCHIFPFSPRPGTAAERLVNRPKECRVKQRIERLRRVAENCSLNVSKRFLNKKMRVLVEARTKTPAGCWEGYTANYIKVTVESSQDLKNRMAEVLLNRATGDLTLGKLVLSSK